MSWIKNFNESSRKNWVTADGSKPDNNQLVVGCLQRIADAVETMSKNYQNLISDRDFYKKRYEETGHEIRRVSRANAALKGHIGRIKRKSDARED